MRARLATVAVGLALPMFSPLPANATDGNTFYQHCGEPDPAWSTWCLGFTLGSVESLAMAGTPGIECAPKGVTPAGQMLDIARKYMRDNPEIRQIRPRC
jgi:hypothetical protein